MALKNLYLICGDEEYLKEQKKKELLDALGAEGSLNFNAFDEENLDLNEVRRLAETVPFMENCRKILLSDTGLFQKSVSEEAEELLENIPEFTVLIFYEKEAESSHRLYKLIQKKGEVFRFTSAEHVKGREASDAKLDVKVWIRDTFRSEKREIDSNCLNALLELSGYDRMNLSREMEKLLCYLMERPAGYRVRMEDIDSICSRTLTDRVFDMVTLKLQGHTDRAMLMLEDLFALRVAPMKILFILVRQFNQAYVLKDLQNRHHNDAQIMTEMEIKDWLLRRLKEQTRSLSASDLRRYLELCAEMETKIKTGDIQERLALEWILTA